MTESSQPSLYVPFETHHRVVYQDPREESVNAQDYARGLAAYLVSQHPQLNIKIVESNGIKCNNVADIHRQLAEMSKNWNLDEDTAAEFPSLVGLAEQGLEPDADSRALSEQLQLAYAYAQHTDVLILVEPLQAVDPQTQSIIFTQLEKRVKKHPVLAQKSKIFIVSETDEVSRRIQRDRSAA